MSRTTSTFWSPGPLRSNTPGRLLVAVTTPQTSLLCRIRIAYQRCADEGQGVDCHAEAGNGYVEVSADARGLVNLARKLSWQSLADTYA